MPGCRGLRGTGPGGEDGPHVRGAPPAERDRPVQRGEERLIAVGGAQRVQPGQLAAQPGGPRRRGAGDERLGDRPERAELLLCRSLGPDRPPRCGPRVAVVLITHRRLTRRDERVLGGDVPGSGHDDQQPTVIGAQAYLLADQPDRHGVAGRAEPHTRQPVHLPHHQPPGGRPQRRHRAQQLPLDDQPLCRDCGDLTVNGGVDLGAPRRRRSIRCREVPEWCLRDHQVGLGIADQVLHDPLRLWVRGLAEVGPEPVVGSEPHVLPGRHDDVSDDGAFQAAHPVGQDLARHPAEHFEALAQQRQRRGSALVGGEPHEPEPRPGQHRAEHMQPGQHAPVDDQVLAR